MPDANKTGSSFIEKTGNIHYEAALEVHLITENNRNRSFPASAYIGVSKLSCLSCFLFLKSLQSAGHTFHTYKRLPGESILPIEIPQSHESGQISRPFIESWMKSIINNGRKSCGGMRFQTAQPKSGSSADSGDDFYKFPLGDLTKIF